MPEEKGGVTWEQTAGAPMPIGQDRRTFSPLPLHPTPCPGKPHLDPPYLHPRGGDVEGAFDLGTQFGHGDEPGVGEQHRSKD